MLWVAQCRKQVIEDTESNREGASLKKTRSREHACP